MKRKDRIILKTAMATLLLLLFFFAQGAIEVITGIEGIPSALIRGAVIWGLVIITLANSIIRYKGISKLGFRSAEKGAAKRMLYFSPLLLIALSPFTAGINFNGGAALILANLFLTLGIGMAEEIFFRGIICGLWLERGVGKAMIISSVLFGFSHLLNIAGGAELGETVLQICFALIYGMVFALIFAESGSLLPCVLLHALHDFCSFISGEASAQFEIFLGAVQFIVLLVYFLYLFRITARKREPALKGR
ncbi:lysostaphin resistance A-like protein [Fusicatenibacter saccharivorans]|uniref:CPBP family intramembrane glutamic endopeptidase n=1 Tax=Fusicatenibacter saccharivorans TaxID=1150298 RepID=UPI003F89923C